jgi:hypothetical protein
MSGSTVCDQENSRSAVVSNCEVRLPSGPVLALKALMRYWETIADRLSAAGWTWGYCSAVTRDGWRWVVDVSRGEGRRYIVESDELLTAFLELESTLLL